MSQLALDIGGQTYAIACRPGQEGHFLGLARVIDAKVTQAATAMGRLDGTRQLLFAALLLADELGELRAAAARAEEVDTVVAAAAEALASRLERLAGPAA